MMASFTCLVLWWRRPEAGLSEFPLSEVSGPLNVVSPEG